VWILVDCTPEGRQLAGRECEGRAEGVDVNGEVPVSNVLVTSCVSKAVEVWKCAGGLSWRTALSPL
jgi:hypothetical protein